MRTFLLLAAAVQSVFCRGIGLYAVQMPYLDPAGVTFANALQHYAAPAPLAYVPQTYAPQTYVPQTYVPQTYVPQTYEPQTYVPQTYGHQTYVPQTYVYTAPLAQPQGGAPGPAPSQNGVQQRFQDQRQQLEAAQQELTARQNQLSQEIQQEMQYQQSAQEQHHHREQHREQQQHQEQQPQQMLYRTGKTYLQPLQQQVLAKQFMDILNRKKRSPQTNTQFDFNTSKIGAAIAGVMNNVFASIGTIASSSCQIDPYQAGCADNKFRNDLTQVQTAVVGTTTDVIKSVKVVGGASCDIDPYQEACKKIN